MKLVKIKISKRGYQCDYTLIGAAEFKAAGLDYGTFCLNLVNISCTDKNPKAYVAWHFHDVFKKLSYVYVDADSLEDEFGPKFYLESNRLYSITKLRALRRSKDYQNQRYAFFSYKFVEHLLGNKTDIDHNFELSGLF